MKYSRAIAAAAAQNRTGVFYVCRTKPTYFVTDKPKVKPVSIVTVLDDGVLVSGSPDTQCACLPDRDIRRGLREVWYRDHLELVGIY